MKQRSVDFGEVVGTDEAFLLQEDALPGMPQDTGESRMSNEATPLWEYHTLGTVNGIRVAPDALNLQIDSVEMLGLALQLVQIPKVFVCWISPEDEEGKRAYSDLLAQAGDRRILIDEETRQYDAGKSAYMVFVRYSEVTYRLHPRFAYLRSGDR